MKRSSLSGKLVRPRPDLSFELEDRGQGRVCVGVDEVGRGCLAGPVVTAAVILPSFVYEEAASASDAWWLELNDSKLLRPAVRERLAKLVLEHAQVHVAWCTVEEIDRWNILRAAMIAMCRAVTPFEGKAQTVLVDGNSDPFQQRYLESARRPPCFDRVQTIVKGDQRSLSIAAASIVAKVHRDRWMNELDAKFPGYEFAEHKGYSTPAHYRAIERLGACEIHRMTFEPLRRMRLAGCRASAHAGQQE